MDRVTLRICLMFRALGKARLTVGALLFAAVLSACGGGDCNCGDKSSPGGNSGDPLAIQGLVSANVVIGQRDFINSLANQGSVVDANSINGPSGSIAAIDNRLYLSDTGSHRVIGFSDFPNANDDLADFALGQMDLTSSLPGVGAAGLDSPTGVWVGDNKLIVTDRGNHRVLIFDPFPVSGLTNAAIVLGQSDFDARRNQCDANHMSWPRSAILAGGRLIVADSGNNRVLIWSTVPTVNGVAPDLVIGQDNFNECGTHYTLDGLAVAESLASPGDIWSDGTRLVVLDSDNHRALIWNEFPSTNNQAADLVLGQENFLQHTKNDSNQDSVYDGYPSARTFNYPYSGVHSNGRQLCIADRLNHRVLIWDSFPVENFQAADFVIGQPGFDEGIANNIPDYEGTDKRASAQTLNSPTGCFFFSGKLVVTDTGNNRLLLFKDF